MSTFTCQLCGGTFERAWTEAEANAEAEAAWGVKDASTKPDEMGEVCEDCFARVMASQRHVSKAPVETVFDDGRRSSWRPCCGVCRSEKIQVKVVASSTSELIVAMAGYCCADCKADWDGSELTEREAQATPAPAWLPKPYPGPGSTGG